MYYSLRSFSESSTNIKLGSYLWISRMENLYLVILSIFQLITNIFCSTVAFE